MREDARAKGRRMLVEARLRVTWVDDSRIQGVIRGDGGEFYEVGFEDGAWCCTCPARSPRCSHLVALQLCTVAVEAIEEPA